MALVVTSVPEVSLSHQNKEECMNDRQILSIYLDFVVFRYLVC